jgi:hypothetical protein
MKQGEQLPLNLFAPIQQETRAFSPKMSQGLNLRPQFLNRIQATIDQIVPHYVPKQEEIQERAVSSQIMATVSEDDVSVNLTNTLCR